MVLQLLGESLGAARCSTRQTIFRVGCVVLILFVFCVSSQAIADDISYRYVELTGTSGRGAGTDNVGLRIAKNMTGKENLCSSLNLLLSIHLLPSFSTQDGTEKPFSCDFWVGTHFLH